MSEETKSTFFNINLDVDYKISYPEGTTPEDLHLAHAQLSRNYIEYAITSAHKDGLSQEERKIYARLEEKIDKCITDKSYVVECGPVDYALIKNAFASPNCKFMAPVAKYVTAFEEANFGSSNN